MNKILTIDTNDDEQLLAEIERLQKSPYVKLAKQTRNKALKQRLYQLRSLEKEGMRLMGITEEE